MFELSDTRRGFLAWEDMLRFKLKFLDNNKTDNLIEVDFDGACWPNPNGAASCGCYIRDGDKTLLREGTFIGSGDGMSSNLAEYRGLIRALEFLRQVGCLDRQIVIRSDSKLVIQQMLGKWKIKGGLYAEVARWAQEIATEFENLTFEWVRREENEICDSLAEDALSATNVINNKKDHVKGDTNE